MEKAMLRLDALRCHTPQDPYSDELDYELMEGGES
jgi:hypothetical protein